MVCGLFLVPAVFETCCGNPFIRVFDVGHPTVKPHIGTGIDHGGYGGQPQTVGTVLRRLQGRPMAMIGVAVLREFHRSCELGHVSDQDGVWWNRVPAFFCNAFPTALGGLHK